MAKKTNVEINGKKYFRIYRKVGEKADGTPIRKKFTGSCESEAIEKYNNYMNNLKNGMSIGYESATLNEVMYNWLFNVKRIAVKPATFVTYESNYRNYIKRSDFAGLRICDIKKITIQKFYNDIYEEKKSTEKIKAIHKLLHSFFEYCVDEGYILKNPAHKVYIPQNTLSAHEEKKIDCFSIDEINSIKKAFKGNKYENLVLTAIYTGMREGELCALKWENVDLKNGIIKVKESLKRVAVFDVNGNKEYKTLTLDPKTKQSVRDIYIPDILVKILKKAPHNSEYVFSNNSEPVSHKSLYFQWQKVLKANDIPHKKFHALRHTYASTLLSNGADLKSVQDLMGHYDIKITQVYLHSLPETKKNVVNIFDNL